MRALLFVLSLSALSVDAAAPKKDCNCPVVYSPVCGSDGKKYPTPCFAACFSATPTTPLENGQCSGAVADIHQKALQPQQQEPQQQPPSDQQHTHHHHHHQQQPQPQPQQAQPQPQPQQDDQQNFNEFRKATLPTQPHRKTDADTNYRGHSMPEVSSLDETGEGGFRHSSHQSNRDDSDDTPDIGQVEFFTMNDDEGFF
eukprot:c5282_g1_i1.p1 GENE.c5282_g1_i1~~c5282_g1_i1.p1  ORF type:complete len:210 (+),score=52.20 c5282_g1_i1:36-632(+)